jgi:hypothetical protein
MFILMPVNLAKQHGYRVSRILRFHMLPDYAAIEARRCFGEELRTMVSKTLKDGESGDVKVILPGYDGNGTDLIKVLDQGGNYSYTIITYGGNDRVNLTSSNVNYAHIILSGSGDDIVYGSGGNEVIHDGSGADIYKLGAGADNLNAGLGNDTYDGGLGVFDTIRFIYAASNGVGTIQNVRGVKVDLGLKSRQDFGVFGKDVVLNFENVAGGLGADTLFGTNGANELAGQGGNDTLWGRGGNDRIRGDAGRDVLDGGSGADIFEMLEPGKSRDVVRYSSVSDSAVTKTSGSFFGNYDQLNFFDTGAEITADRIDLSAFAGKFSFIGSFGFSSGSTNQVRIDASRNIGGFTGRDTIVYIDTDSDSAAEMRIYVMDATLGKVDFIL